MPEPPEPGIYQLRAVLLGISPIIWKGAHAIVYRTLFGKLELSSPRLFHCQCQPQPTRSFSPLAELLVERTAPELLWYLWHGNVFKALRQIDHLETDIEGEIITGESSEKLRKALQEFQTYFDVTCLPI